MVSTVSLQPKSRQMGQALLYRINLPNDDESERLIRDVLRTLAGRFDRAEVKVDRVVYNAARIWKLYGTLARKGDSTPERPHRRAEIVRVPEQIAEVTPELLVALVAESKAELNSRPPRPASTTGTGQITRGRRHKALVSLAGTMLNRGMGQAEIEAALLATNQERCIPPYDEGEVRRLVTDLIRRYADKEHAGNSAPEPAVPENGGDLFDRQIQLRKEIRLCSRIRG